MRLSTEDQARIEATVVAAEKRTGAEFALVVAQAADRYDGWPALWAALLAMLTGGGIALALPQWPVQSMFAVQVVVLVAAGLVLHLPALRPMLVPRRVRREEADKLARLQFSALVQRRTSNRVGVLLFVSLAERHIEILADRAIDERVPEAAWRGIIDGFAGHLRAGRLADGFTEALERCTALLEKEFPVPPDDTDELPNRVTFV